MLAVTGATGMIGGYLLKNLAMPYRALVRNPADIRTNSDDVLGELQNHYDTGRLVEGAETLIHLACSTNPRSSNRDIHADLTQNLVPSVELFQSFLKANPSGHIIFVSTGGAMYDNTRNAGAITEDALPLPWSSYGIHKLAAEQYLTMLVKNTQAKATIMRISNPYGTLLPSGRSQGIIGVALGLLRNNQPLKIIENPESVRDYIHMDDVVQAFEKTINTPPKSGEVNLYHIGSGTGRSIQQIVAAINAVTGKTLATEITPEAQKTKPTYNILNCEKAGRELGWHSRITLEDGLKKML